jgi:anti-sigma B factor antagonist
MKIDINHKDFLEVLLDGRLDTTTSIELDKKLKEIEIPEELVVLDFTNLEYISSAGLRVLLQLKKSLEKNNKKLEIHNINKVVKEVFNVTGFKNVLDIK